ncbi:uncharacterized protein LOC110269208 [Arachis ipaensis]|uniref:uncharacterized protein LOC110269208 n=1 Tax=Arachis ipaensis TaxID=130454 RepID=UPI000A2B8DEC|nr:uncharacterized protein LOC110269208 [Arachis ipaensis]
MCLYIISFAVVYTIEFQKHGLPHAHILLFLHHDDKFPTEKDMDRIISAEIPNKVNDPLYYEAVEKHMMHGPCGSIRKDSPCMKNGQCMRHFPKRFVASTTIDEDGYPVYRRRDDGKIITKSGVELDNRYVVPHNRKLLLKYGAHINVEWCNQSRSIKYLFRYVNKGQMTVYISSCEAAWRIFGYSIHYRNPSVVRLGFQLPGEQPVIFKDDENMDDVARKESVKESMFLGWFEANKKYPEARSLTYVEFPSKFVWKANTRKWFPRKSHVIIGRIFFVPPRSGEIYYLRLLLNFVRGPTSYEQIRTIDGVVYSTFRDACYAYELLADDKEYIDAIEEASHWGSGEYLRRLYATLLFSNSMARPEHVWESTQRMLSDDILHRQRRLLNNQGIRSKGQIMLTVASSGIASLLLPGGRTTHSRFAIPLNLDEFSTCNIKQNTPLAELIIRAKLIVWDEAPMVNKLCIEALDRTMRDILRFNNIASLEQPFGGKTVVFGGDF